MRLFLFFFLLFVPSNFGWIFVVNHGSPVLLLMVFTFLLSMYPYQFSIQILLLLIKLKLFKETDTHNQISSNSIMEINPRKLMN